MARPRSGSPSTSRGGRIVRTVDLEEALFVLPDASLRLDPDAVVVNLARPGGDILVETALETAGGPAPDDLDWASPQGWTCTREAGRIRLTPPTDLEPGRDAVKPSLGGGQAFTVTAVASPHTGRTFVTRPRGAAVLAVHASLPEGARVGYVGGGNDRVGVWMKRLGVDVVDLDPERLARGDLADLTTVVVGIFAFGTRPDLAAAAARLQGLGRGWRPSRDPLPPPLGRLGIRTPPAAAGSRSACRPCAGA
jgi:hypothetical protein